MGKKMRINELLVNVRNERNFSFNYKNNKMEDNLFELLENSDGDYTYIGSADLVQNYYKMNPNSEWYIKSIFELGFPFHFYTNLDNGPTDKANYNLLIRKQLENQFWSIYIFTKEKPEKINIGFSEHETLAFKYTLDSKENSFSKFNPNPKELVEKFIPPTISFRFFYYMTEALDQIQKCIESDLIPEVTQEDSEQNMYSFNSIPYDAFNLNYLHNLSRYKKTIVDGFGLPSKNEYIKKISECTEFIFLGDEYYSFEIKKVT